MTRTRALGLLVLLVLGVAVFTYLAPVRSAGPRRDWPQQRVRIVTSAAAGGGSDLVVRIVAEALSARWDTPVIVDNRPGADGILAVRALLDARDGHTLLFAQSSVATANPHLIASLPYDAEHDLVPIAQVVDDFIGLVCAPSLAVSSVADLLREARNNPGALTYTTVPGSPYLMAAGLLAHASVGMTYVGYRNALDSTVDLTAGRVHMALLPVGSVLGQIKSGNLKLLAVMTTRRAPVVPDVPTIGEMGFPGFAFDGLLGFFGARGVDVELRDRIGSGVGTVLADDQILKRLSNFGYAVNARPAREYGAVLDEQRTRFGVIARNAGVTPRF